MIEILYNVACITKTLISACTHYVTEEDIEFNDYIYENIKPEVITADRYKVKYRDDYLWGKIYHRTIFKSLRFPEGKLYEDIYTTYKALFYAEKIACISEKLYCYFINRNGISNSAWNLTNLDAIEAMKEQIFSMILKDILKHF